MKQSITIPVSITNNNSPEDFIRCWCFDCRKIFLTDGNSPIGASTCLHCGNKNYDFDINFRYSKRAKRRGTAKTENPENSIRRK